MRNKSWIAFAAGRYIRSGRKNKSSPSSILSILGIATGVFALIVVLAVMNGFQMGFIESILEISSYHIRVEKPENTPLDPALLQSLRDRPEVAAALPFIEIQSIARGNRRAQQGALLRGIPADAATADPSLAAKLSFEDGSFDLSDPHAILLGAELASTLGVRVGDEVSLLSLSGSALDSITPEDAMFTVTGLFRSGFYEYDLGWGFINIDTAATLEGTAAHWVYGVKLHDRFRDQAAMAAIASAHPDTTVTSWRFFNRAFFGALRTEKVLMFVLVALIFVVVALNIFQAQRRSVLERREEIGLLRAVGASATEVRLIFACDGFIVGLSGALLGFLPALWIAGHISAFFSGLERVANLGIDGLNALVSFFSSGHLHGAEAFSVFSPAVFYIKEIPARVVPMEAAIIFLFGLASATLASWLASAQATGVRPAEVLRYE